MGELSFVAEWALLGHGLRFGVDLPASDGEPIRWSGLPRITGLQVDEYCNAGNLQNETACEEGEARPTNRLAV